MENDYMLTTFDNPYNPYDQFDEWLMFDNEKGYNTCSYLARIANLSDDMTQKEEEDEIQRAIDEIIDNDFLNIYRRIRKNDTVT